MFLKGVWFIIAGVMLLGHTPALAESFLRVCKNGVTYYYLASREPGQSGRVAKKNPKLRGEAWIQAQSLPPDQLASSAKTPVREESRGNQKFASAPAAPAAPALPQLMPGPSNDWPIVQPPDVKEDIGAATRYLFRLLTKLGYQHAPVLPVCEAGPLWVPRHRAAAVQPPQIAVPDAWVNLLKEAREPRLEFAPGRPGPEAGLQRYCFPVAGPYSFKDTWGEGRSGGRIHRAVDIFAQEGTEVYAVTTGVITTLATLPEAGITLLMLGQDGRGYGYMHLRGYAPGLAEGKVVRTGELLGYVGRTGIQQSAAHLHFQAYADHRLCRDDLLNPYPFLVQLCHGIGVNDLYQHRLAQLEDRDIKTDRIQVYRHSVAAARRTRGDQPGARRSSILVIKNY